MLNVLLVLLKDWVPIFHYESHEKGISSNFFFKDKESELEAVVLFFQDNVTGNQWN